MKTKFKVWVEIERIECDDNGNEVDYIDEDFPMAIAYRDTLPDAEEIQMMIVNTFGEIY